MKYKGKKLEGLNTDILVLPRGNERVVFKAQAIKSYSEFDELCPMPEPPEKLLPGGVKEKDVRDPAFIKRLEEYGIKKTNYTIIKSLEISEDVEWETVDLKKPQTWENWRKELSDAGFTEVETLRILQLCTRVNVLDEDLLNAAKESFLAEALQREK
jgi:hypothetical protein